jgi:hypothetical protein
VSERHNHHAISVGTAVKRNSDYREYWREPCLGSRTDIRLVIDSAGSVKSCFTV